MQMAVHSSSEKHGRYVRFELVIIFFDVAYFSRARHVRYFLPAFGERFFESPLSGHNSPVNDGPMPFLTRYDVYGLDLDAKFAWVSPRKSFEV